jgi:hypothetical protein
MKKQNAFVTWLLYGSAKKATSSSATEAEALARIAPEAPVPFTTTPLAAAPIAPAAPALVPAAPVCAATVTIDNVPAVATPNALVAPTHVPAEPVRATVTVDNVPTATYSFMPTKASASLNTTTAAADDPFEEFLLHMQSGKRPFRKPGMTVKQEFELWLAHRTKTVQAAATAPPQTRLRA